MENNNTPFKGMGSVLYGDIDDLLTYLALIPDKGRMVKMWERSLDKRLDDYRRTYSPLRDFMDSFAEEEHGNVEREIKDAGRKLIYEVDLVRRTLGIELNEAFVKRWTEFFTVTDYDVYALWAINGKQYKVGQGLFVKLSERQVDYLYKSLKESNFIDGEFEHFRSIFSGAGVPANFERILWKSKEKESLLRLLCGLKQMEPRPRYNTEIGKNAHHFFLHGNEPVNLNRAKMEKRNDKKPSVKVIEKILSATLKQ